MGRRTVPQKKMKSLHQKWQQEHDRWSREMEKMEREQLEALDMINHVEDKLRELKFEMEDIRDEIAQHEDLMEQQILAFQNVQDGVIDSSKLADSESINEQATIHDDRRQEFMKFSKKHQFFYKQLKKLKDAIDFS